MATVNKIDYSETLKGTTLVVYRFMLTSSKPVGIRELARELGLSSHSVAQHHLNRLEAVGLVKFEWGNYVVDKIVLQHYIRIGHFLIARPMIYLIFIISVFIIELLAYTTLPFQIYPLIFFIQIPVLSIFIYELIKTHQNDRL